MINKWKKLVLPWLILSVSLSLSFAVAIMRSSTNASAHREQAKLSVLDSATEPSAPKALKAYGNLPLAFAPNVGQLDERVRYAAQAGNASFYFGSKELQFVLRKDGSGLALRLSFVGANPAPEITSTGSMSGTINYLIGNDSAQWHTGIKTYSEIIYHNLWPGIDAKFYGDNGALKYEFHVAPGADPNNIRLAYHGADRLSLDKGGDLQIHTTLATLEDSRPVSYQIINGGRVPVDSSYALADGKHGFALGPYDLNRSLVIDPVLSYSTFLGSVGNDQGFSIAVDASGSAYITGVTASVSFPATVGAFDTGFNGGTGDVFVTKLNPSGSALVYSTYVGGSLSDQGNGIDVDSEGNAYVTGSTTSTNFPTTPGVFDTSYNSGIDGFVTKLNADGSNLLYSTYLGGSAPGILCSPAPCPDDTGAGIAVDAAGQAYVTGGTRSRDFPTTPGAFDTSYISGANNHVFVTKLDPNGSALIYSTYLGGGTGEAGAGIAIDAAGNAYVTGVTSSNGFPTTPGAFDTTNTGGDAFVTKVNAEGSGLIYSTFLGGGASDIGTGIAIDLDGNAFVTGTTGSPDFPTTPGALDASLAGGQDAFVVKLNSFGSNLLYGTYLGGGLNENSQALAVDGLGNVYVTGTTGSTDFPTTPGAFDSTFNGGIIDVFMSILNPTGSSLLYSTFFGGASGENGRAIAVDNAGGVYVTGITSSNTFPITAGSFDPTFNGGADAFVIKLSNQPPEANEDSAITDEDNSVNVHVIANDSDLDGDPLTISEITQGMNGSVTINADNTLTYSPAANFNGTDTFTYTVTDTFGATDSATVSVTINPINDPPLADNVNATTNEDEAIQIDLIASDIDNTELTFSVVSGPANGTLSSINGSVVSYTPNANFYGSDSFAFKANDGMADSNVATVSITVTPVNDPPDAIEDSVSTNEEVPVTITVLANDVDVDGNALTLTEVTQGTHGAVIINQDGSITYTPVVNFFGSDSFSYTINDGNGGTDTASVNVVVTNVQDPPNASDDGATVSEDSAGNSINVLTNDLDVDGNMLSVASVTQGSHGTVVNNLTSVSYTPNANYFGPDSFTYTIADGEGGSDTATVNITVTNVNDAPLATADSYSTNANTTLVIAAPGVLANDADADSDTLTAVLVTNVSHGTLSLADDGSLTYAPNLNFFGTDSFSYHASDGRANSNTATVNITVGNNLIVFTSTRDGNSEIYSMGVDGSSPTRVTNNPATDAFPVWSPDRTKIAFNSNRDGSFEIYVMNSDGSAPVKLTTGALVEGPVAWSPDGTKLAFSSQRDGNPEIYLMNADGTGQLRLTKQRGMDLNPSWSPDGLKIAFSSDRKRSFEIYVMNADGTNVTQLTKNSFADVNPAWSPDSTKIAFSTNRDGNFEIYTMNADGSGLVRLTINSEADNEPAWLFDGTKILFTSQRDGNAEIYVMNPDGSGQTRLTTNAAADTSPN